MPASLKKLALGNVVFRPPQENLSVVTTAMAWSKARENPLTEAVVAIVGKTGLVRKTR